MASILGRLKAFDAFPKIQDDFYSKTMSGGVITLVSTVAMVFLFFSELHLFLSMRTAHHLSVDTSRGAKIQVELDVVMPRMPCNWISVDAIDVSGNVQLGVEHDIYRQRLDRAGKTLEAAKSLVVGPTDEPVPDHLDPSKPDPAKLDPNYCGSCYGAQSHEGHCCNTCSEVREAYRKKGWSISDFNAIEQCKREGFNDEILKSQGEGCRIYGKLEVAKVAGNIHIAPGKAYQQGGMHVHDLQPFRNVNFDVSHTIQKLAFGTAYPGQTNPLNGATFDQGKSSTPIPTGVGQPPVTAAGMYQYFLKVVPSAYTNLRNVSTLSNQYSVTEHFKPATGMGGGGILPGVFFFYDLSPIKVTVVEEKLSLLHFVTNVCAIVGGVFTVSGIVDSILYHGDKLIRKKMEIGKFS